MKRRLIIALATAAILVAGLGIAWSRADKTIRQNARIRVLDVVHGAGLRLPERDREHMQDRSGLEDISNVSCRDCHGATTNSLPWAQPRPRHASPSGLAVSARGDRLFAAAPDTDEVIEVETSTLKVLRRAALPGRPTSVVLHEPSGSLLVVCRDQDRVARLDLGTLTEKESVFVGLGPVGLAIASQGAIETTRVVVANTLSDDISLLALQPLREVRRLPAGREPYGVATSADGTAAYVANRLAVMPGIDRAPASELTAIDLVTGRISARHRLDSAHLSEAVATLPTRGWILTPMVRVRNLVPITQVARGWVMSAGLALVTPDHSSVIQVPTDEANRYFADPSDLVIDPVRERAYLVSGGGDAVSVIDLQRLHLWLQSASESTLRTAIHQLEVSGDYVLARIPTGRNPRRATLSPDGTRLFVSEYLDNAILAIDTTTLKPQGRIVLGAAGLDDPIRRGERMFTWAGKTFQGQFSCRSCHPDGHVDGLNYDFDGDGVGDNLLDNRSLQGVASTWPFKWNGKNPSLEIQCGPRFAKVLMRTDPFEGQALKDLTVYIQSLPPARTRHAQERALSPAQERGRALFYATETPSRIPIPTERRCTTCHRPPLFTNRAKTAVGTRGLNDTTDHFDTPHLLGIAASAPYLHDGRAKSLEELWTLYQTNDLHGVSSYMSKQQLNDLVEFLKTL
ncbi:MAG: hypothetical protein JNK85_03175 [Verrucomicrobiales bacterium]|nr:hypothetical protein [Verrucomicrobiales bacterium]